MEQKAKSKGAKKGFYEVEVPMTAVKISLYGGAPDDFDGRVIKLDMTRNLRGKNLELRMKVKNEGGKLYAIPVSSIIAGSYIRRAMRRGADYVEDSFKVTCKDAIMVVKPFMITRRRVSRAVRKVLRDNARKYVEDYMSIRNAKELFSDVVIGKLQKGMALKLKKIYPLAFSEIRVFEMIGERSPQNVEEKSGVSGEGKTWIGDVENREEVEKQVED